MFIAYWDQFRYLELGRNTASWKMSEGMLKPSVTASAICSSVNSAALDSFSPCKAQGTHTRQRAAQLPREHEDYVLFVWGPRKNKESQNAPEVLICIPI